MYKPQFNIPQTTVLVAALIYFELNQWGIQCNFSTPKMELNNDTAKAGEYEQKKKKDPNKIVGFLTSITIEPMTILSSLSENIVSIPQDQMLLYKTCIQQKYNLR